MNNLNYFLMRRIHSLLGVFPLGIFLFNHMLTNSTSVFGIDFFEEKVALIHMLGPLLPFVEAVFIFIPLALHIALGVYIATQAKIEVGRTMPYARNWAFAFQRWTGWLALIFIGYHVIHLRFLHDMKAEPFSVELGQMFAGPFAIPYILFYLVGSLSVIYHFANGLCTFCMSWGLTTGPRSYKLVEMAAAGLGLLLTGMMLASIVSFNKFGREMNAMSEQERSAVIADLQAIHKH